MKNFKNGHKVHKLSTLLIHYTGSSLCYLSFIFRQLNWTTFLITNLQEKPVIFKIWQNVKETEFI